MHIRQRHLMLVAVASLLLAGACGGDNDSSPAATPAASPTREIASEAIRPGWLPARFPLPAGTTIVTDNPAARGGGTAEFLVPSEIVHTVRFMEVNLETPRHGFTVVAQGGNETGVGFTLDDQQGEYEGEVTFRPGGEQTTVFEPGREPTTIIMVTLTPK